MAIIYSYPTATPASGDLIGTDTSTTNQATKNFTVQSILDLFTVVGNDLQAVLDFGNIATGKDIILGSQDPTQTIYANSFSTGVASIIGGVGQNFTDFTSTRITGVIQAASAAQQFITSLGTQTTGIVINSDWNNTTGTYGVTGTAVVTDLLAAGYVRNNFQVASTKAIMDYIASTPNNETLAQTLANGNDSGGVKDISMTGAISNITLVDSGTAAVPVTTQGRIIMGAGNDLQIYHDGTNSFVRDDGTGDFFFTSNGNGFYFQSETGENLATFDDDGSVDLYHDNSKKFETTATGVDIAGVIKVSDGVDSSPSYTFTGDTNTGVFLAAANRVGISGGGVLGLTVDATDTVVEGNFTVGGDFISLSTTTATFGGKVSGSDPTVDIDFATKGYVDGEVDGKTLSYKDASATTYQLNLFADKLQLKGGTNITSTASSVNATIADVTFNLDNSIVLTGQVKADNFTTTAETATWVTTVLDGFTSITSTAFVGELTGNASTATALASTGAITLLGDTTGGPNTYTSGGAVNVTTAIADSVVYNKELQVFKIRKMQDLFKLLIVY